MAGSDERAAGWIRDIEGAVIALAMGEYEDATERRAIEAHLEGARRRLLAELATARLRASLAEEVAEAVVRERDAADRDLAAARGERRMAGGSGERAAELREYAERVMETAYGNVSSPEPMDYAAAQALADLLAERERLVAENARLREAMDAAATYLSFLYGDDGQNREAHETVAYLRAVLGHIAVGPLVEHFWWEQHGDFLRAAMARNAEHREALGEPQP